MATWVTPTKLNHVTSHFNPNRRHPITGRVQPHTGTDYRAYTGTAIYAASSGVVVRSTDNGGVAGKYIRIDHGGGIWSGYSHLSQRLVSVGERVSAGEVIGRSGSTGSATAAHLHFEISVNGRKVDPVDFLEDRVFTVSRPVGGTGTVPDVGPIKRPEPLMSAKQVWDYPLTSKHVKTTPKASTFLTETNRAAFEARDNSGYVIKQNLLLESYLLRIIEMLAKQNNITAKELADAIVPGLIEPLVTAVGTDLGLTVEQIEEGVDNALREFFGNLPK